MLGGGVCRDVPQSAEHVLLKEDPLYKPLAKNFVPRSRVAVPGCSLGVKMRVGFQLLGLWEVSGEAS